MGLKDAPTTASTLFSAYASFAASTMLVRSMTDQLIPRQLHSYIYSSLSYLLPLSPHLTLIIDEHSGMTRNQVYDAAELYLGTKISPLTERLRVSKTPRKKTISISIDQGQQVNDTFDNVKLTWRYVCSSDQRSESQNHSLRRHNNNNQSSEKRCFELTFHKKHKDKVVDFYLPHVFAQANAIKQKEKVVKLYTRDPCLGDDENGMGSSIWGSVNLEHPATFKRWPWSRSLREPLEDMDSGKAWKRGYLLYGPPGTGKSSLIAAMANYLKFDVYDLELTSIHSNYDLRRILLSTTNRSILVIEDIDCSLEMHDRQFDEQQHFVYQQQSNNRLTLSGLLNFIDGLWSSCGDARIIVFTTNHKDRLDPALLRPGRMDIHIHMSYCTTSGFRILASNYLGFHGDNHHHRLWGEIEGLIECAKVTPAEVAEELMKSDDVDVALDRLANFLKHNKVENDETEEEANKIENQEAKRQKMDDHNVNKIGGGGFGRGKGRPMQQ
ncbi:P-loop containing nucleoside triphosphate hydrolases superfamily protein [Prunus dulcis]|uniref:P-loop containing nucleoside triphosphate hydrolases superfamily protein n=1 Tax=Prunus dulcis TaxID=3755 RepID=A0A4Y1RUH3_PRUDU|nr:P-loop containing nucleoside triphosphate hydrolases superfamily protein [Prunus dulcis]